MGKCSKGVAAASPCRGLVFFYGPSCALLLLHGNMDHRQDDACSTRFLRSLNVILSAVCLVILRELLTTYRQQTFQQPPLFVHVNHTATTTISNRSTPARSAAKQQRPTPPSTAASSSSEAISSDLHALILALYPLHWFFSFLYYTDVASLLFLLLAQLQVRTGSATVTVEIPKLECAHLLWLESQTLNAPSYLSSCNLFLSFQTALCL